MADIHPALGSGLGRGQHLPSACQGLSAHEAEHTSRPRGLAWEAPVPSEQLPSSRHELIGAADAMKGGTEGEAGRAVQIGAL